MAGNCTRGLSNLEPRCSDESSHVAYERNEVHKQLLKELTQEYIEMGYSHEWAEDQAYCVIDDAMIDRRYHHSWDV